MLQGPVSQEPSVWEWLWWCQLAQQKAVSEGSNNYLHSENIFFFQLLRVSVPKNQTHWFWALNSGVVEIPRWINTLIFQVFIVGFFPFKRGYSLHICETAESTLRFLRCIITSRRLTCCDVGFYISENVVLLFIGIELGAYFCIFALISVLADDLFTNRINCMHFLNCRAVSF